MELSELAKALSKFQSEVTPPTKDREVSFQGRRYKYSDLSTVIQAVKKSLADNGLCVSQSPVFSDGDFYLLTRLIHVSGQRLDSTYPLPKDVRPQELGSALTYARRYSLCAILGISADEDDDGQTANEAKKSSVMDDKRQIEASGNQGSDIPPPSDWDNLSDPIPNFTQEDASLKKIPEDDVADKYEFQTGKYSGITFGDFVKRDVGGASSYAKFLEKTLKEGGKLSGEKRDFLAYARRKGLFNISVKNK